MTVPRYIVYTFFILTLTCCPVLVHAQQPDTLVVFNAAAEIPGELPETWEHVLGKDQRVYTTYTIERSIDGNYLRARAAASSSYLELDLGEIDPDEYPLLDWSWKVDEFPQTAWEQNESQDDFALRIELVYDFPGSWKNPLNIIRKGFFTTVFKRYPPEHIISYVWSVNVPSMTPYTSPSSKRTTIIPIESNNVIKSRWMREQTNPRDAIRTIAPNKHLVLKKIRIFTDTDDSNSMADSGLKYLYLISGTEQ